MRGRRIFVSSAAWSKTADTDMPRSSASFVICAASAGSARQRSVIVRRRLFEHLFRAGFSSTVMLLSGRHFANESRDELQCKQMHTRNNCTFIMQISAHSKRSASYAEISELRFFRLVATESSHASKSAWGMQGGSPLAGDRTGPAAPSQACGAVAPRMACLPVSSGCLTEIRE